MNGRMISGWRMDGGWRINEQMDDKLMDNGRWMNSPVKVWMISRCRRIPDELMNEGVDDKWMEHLDAECRLEHGTHAVGSRVKEMGRGGKGGGKCGREGCGALLF